MLCLLSCNVNNMITYLYFIIFVQLCTEFLSLGVFQFIVKIFIADTGSYELVPDQVCGVFFGWAKLELHGMYKVIVNMGWDTLCGVAKRVTVCVHWLVVTCSMRWMN